MITTELQPLLLTSSGQSYSLEGESILTLEGRINTLQRQLFNAKEEQCAISCIKWANRIICFPITVSCSVICCPCIVCFGINDYDVSTSIFCHGEENRYLPDKWCCLPRETRKPPIEFCPECIPACCWESSNKEKRIQQNLAEAISAKNGTAPPPRQQIIDYVPPKRKLIGKLDPSIHEGGGC